MPTQKPGARAARPSGDAPAVKPRAAFAYDYFISYSSPDKADAKFVEGILRGQGARIWLQAYDSRMSENIAEAVTGAISTSRNFIAMLSSHYLESAWTKRELSWFVSSQLNRGANERHLIIIECEPVQPDNCILQVSYRGALHNKASDAERRAEVIRALKHEAAEDRRALTAVFDAGTPNPPNCFGRDMELARIRGYFFPSGAADGIAAQAAPPPISNRRVLIQAGPGFGKTTLAAYFARSHQGYFAGVWWIPSQDPATLLAAVTAIAPPARDSGSPTPEFARRLLARHFQDTTAPFLVIFDNVGARSEDAGPPAPTGAGASPQGTESLVVELAGCLGGNVRVLMTSRRPGWDDGAELIELKGLAPEAAAEFLRKRARRACDAEGSLRLAADLGGLPLALDHAGAYCARANRSFDGYRQDLLELMQRAPVDVEYDATVFATTTKSLAHARKICGDADAVTRLADLLSFCSADRIPRALCLRALDGNELLADDAIGALREVALLNDSEAYPDGEPAVGVHRLVQRIIRADTEGTGRSNGVISRLMPFLCEQLAGASEAGAPAADQTLRVRKYLPHLFQALPHLDAPGFRGTEAGDLLDQVAKLVVLSLEEQTVAGGGDAPIPEHLPRLLGCFYEVDPLAEPIERLLEQMKGQPNAWKAFREACLNEGNYVLRFALSTALADAIQQPGSPYSIKEAAALVEKPQTLNHFELGGYTLKGYYSTRPDATPDPKLLHRLAAHPCYPGRSILGDLMLNLVYQRQTPSQLLPPSEGDNHRFWSPAWDFIRYDVNAIIAAECFNRGTEPPGPDSEARQEFEYLQDLQHQRDALLAELTRSPEIREIVNDYFGIGADTDRMTDQKAAFAALRRDRLLTPVLRLLFGHPLWSVAEAAASVIASLYARADETEDDDARNDYHAAIAELLDPQAPWRVRFGAMEAAFQIRLHERPKMKTFADGVHRFYHDQNSKLRGLCAENLISVMLNANNKHRLQLAAEFETEMRCWLRDEDCWVLEHVHRYFHALARRDQDMLRDDRVAALLAQCSRLCDGLDAWWLVDRERFLRHIEARKQHLRGG